MTDPLAECDDNASTPLSPNERHDLIPSYITTRDQLNEVEQLGIAAADRWAFGRKRPVLDQDFLFRLHKRMFGDVWKWAGAPRNSERNIGALQGQEQRSPPRRNSLVPVTPSSGGMSMTEIIT